MSQRKPTGAVGSPMDDSLATVRVVVTDTRAARIPHTGRRLVSSQSDAFVPTQRRPGAATKNGTYSLRAGARSAVPRRRTAPIVCALARGLRCRDEERHLSGVASRAGDLYPDEMAALAIHRELHRHTLVDVLAALSRDGTPEDARWPGTKNLGCSCGPHIRLDIGFRVPTIRFVVKVPHT